MKNLSEIYACVFGVIFFNFGRYRTVFGSTRVERRSLELDNRSRALRNPWDFEEADQTACTTEDNVREYCYPEVGTYFISKYFGFDMTVGNFYPFLTSFQTLTGHNYVT